MINSIRLVLKELEDTLPQINEHEFNQLFKEILEAEKVIVVGVGRVMLSLKAWVKRFKHLDININYFGSETEDPVGPNDLVIVGSSSGETLIPKIIAKKAKELEAKLFYIGCTPESTVGKIADSKLILFGKSQFKSMNEYPSKQPMSSLFEQQLYLLGDILAAEIMKHKSLEDDDVKSKHANLE